jgi:hypothetical protein
MPGPLAQGSFDSGNATVGAATVAGDIMCVPTGTTNMKLTITGLDGSNTVKTQKRTAGGVFADQTTYNSDQNAVNVTVAAGEEWRCVVISQQPIRDIRYKLSCES